MLQGYLQQVIRETNRDFFVFFFPIKVARDHIQGLVNSPLMTALAQVQNSDWINSFTPRENNGFFRLASM